MVGDAQDKERWAEYRRYLKMAAEIERQVVDPFTPSHARASLLERANDYRRYALHLTR